MQNKDERPLVLVSIGIVVLYVCCTLPMAILWIIGQRPDNDVLFQVAMVPYFIIALHGKSRPTPIHRTSFAKHAKHLISKSKSLSTSEHCQIFRASANGAELLNYAANFYIFFFCRSSCICHIQSYMYMGDLIFLAAYGH